MTRVGDDYPCGEILPDYETGKRTWWAEAQEVAVVVDDCCEWHSSTCEPPSELCCARCPETYHPRHEGARCVLDRP